MSYDIQLFKKLEDTTVEKSAATVLGSDTYALDPESFHFQGKALSRALKKLNPQLEEFSSEGCLTLSSAEN